MAQDETFGEGGGPARPERREPDASGIDWEAVRADFLYSGMAQRRIAWKHGLGEDKVRARRRAEGWERVTPVVKLPTRRRTGPRDGEPPTPTQKRRTGLVKRLYAMISAKLDEIEWRMGEAAEGAAPRSAPDIEREARAMTALMQAYTKVKELEAQTRRDGKGSDRNAARGLTDDAEQLRRDLADRIARLARGGNA